MQRVSIREVERDLFAVNRSHTAEIVSDQETQHCGEGLGDRLIVRFVTAGSHVAAGRNCPNQGWVSGISEKLHIVQP